MGHPPDHWNGVKINAGLVFCVGLLWWASDSPSATLTLGGIGGLAAYCFLAYKEAMAVELRLSPLAAHFALNALGLGLSAIYMGRVIARGEELGFGRFVIDPRDIAVGYVLYLLGSLFFHAGIQLLRPTTQSPTASSALRPSKRLAGWIAVYWSIGMFTACFAGQLAAMSSALVQVLKGFVLTSTCLLATVPRKRLPLSTTVFIAFMAIGMAGLLIINLSTNSKLEIMTAFLPIVWLCVLHPVLRKFLPIVAVGLTALYLGFVQPVVTRIRESENRGPADVLMGFSEALSGDGVRTNLSSGFNDQLEQFLYRGCISIPIGFLYRKVEENGLQFGASTVFSYAFVPRFLWPDKPNVTRSAWFTYYLGFSPSEAEATSATGMTVVGELYWNFGLFGMLIGMLLVGLVTGKLWRMAGTDVLKHPLYMHLYVFLITSMWGLEGDVTSQVTGLVATALIFAVLFKVVAAQGRLQGKSGDAHREDFAPPAAAG